MTTRIQFSDRKFARFRFIGHGFYTDPLSRKVYTKVKSISGNRWSMEEVE